MECKGKNMKNVLKVFVAGEIIIVLVLYGFMLFVNQESAINDKDRFGISLLGVMVNLFFIVILVGAISEKNYKELGDILTCSWNKIKEEDCEIKDEK